MGEAEKMLKCLQRQNTGQSHDARNVQSGGGILELDQKSKCLLVERERERYLCIFQYIRYEIEMNVSDI